MKRCLILSLVVVFRFVQDVSAVITYEGEWQTWLPPEAKIDKVSPDLDNLHYAGPPANDPETAQFALIDYRDMDRKCVIEDGEKKWVEEDAGLNPNRTKWYCTGKGKMTQGALTSKYTPGKVIESPVNITAKIFNGPDYNPKDDPVNVAWAPRFLQVFKVGVLLKGTSDTDYWEDDKETVLYIHERGLAKATEGATETGILEEPGAVHPVKTWRRDLVWKTVERTSTGNITGMQKKICFTQNMLSQGKYRVWLITSGWHIPFGGTSIMLKLLGLSSPYSKALIEIIIELSGSPGGRCTACDAFVAGNSVIENQTQKEIKQVWADNHGTGWWVDAPIDGLTINGEEIKLVEDSERKGSFEVKTMAGGTDYHTVDFFNSTVKAEGTRMSWGCSRPVYKK